MLRPRGRVAASGTQPQLQAAGAPAGVPGTAAGLRSANPIRDSDVSEQCYLRSSGDPWTPINRQATRGAEGERTGSQAVGHLMIMGGRGLLRHSAMAKQYCSFSSIVARHYSKIGFFK